MRKNNFFMKKTRFSFVGIENMSTFAAQTKKNKRCNRNVAQLVAHYVRDVGVGRSSRLIPTEERQMILYHLPLFHTTPQ